MTKRYAQDVTNMLKQVCDVEVVIDGITSTQRKTHYICKKDQNSESIIKWKNQYKLKEGGRNYKKNH